MPKSRRCACCSSRLEPAQELRFLVESDNLDDPDQLSLIRSLPAINGRPIPVCMPCQSLVEAAKLQSTVRRAPFRPALFNAVGLFAVGWLVHALLFGSRS